MLPQNSVDPAAIADQIAASLGPKIREIHEHHPIRAGILSEVCRRFLQVIRLTTLGPVAVTIAIYNIVLLVIGGAQWGVEVVSVGIAMVLTFIPFHLSRKNEINHRA